MKKRKIHVYLLASLIALAVAAPSFAEEVQVRDARGSVRLETRGKEQYLLSSVASGNAPVATLKVWDGKYDGAMSALKRVDISKDLSVIEVEGSDGDSGFLELVAWSPASGKMVHLLSAFDFEYQLAAAKGEMLQVTLSQPEDAPGYGEFHLKEGKISDACNAALAVVAAADKKLKAEIATGGKNPGQKQLARINQLEQEKSARWPHLLRFTLADLSAVQVDCK